MYIHAYWCLSSFISICLNKSVGASAYEAKCVTLTHVCQTHWHVLHELISMFYSNVHSGWLVSILTIIVDIMPFSNANTKLSTKDTSFHHAQPRPWFRREFRTTWAARRCMAHTLSHLSLDVLKLDLFAAFAGDVASEMRIGVVTCIHITSPTDQS